MSRRAYKRDGHLTGVATGFIDLDAKIGGLNRSDLVILAGRPSMGKTALATNIAFNAAWAYREEADDNGAAHVVDGAAVAFFSLGDVGRATGYALALRGVGHSFGKVAPRSVER